MRPIEFRVWHKDARMMVIPEKQSDAFRWDEEGQSIEIMQFTGLHDKNGVKIFCGDIIDFNGGDICEVFFENGCFWAENEKLSKHPVGQWIHYSDSAIVIGNIHQNPELLEK